MQSGALHWRTRGRAFEIEYGALGDWLGESVEPFNDWGWRYEPMPPTSSSGTGAPVTSLLTEARETLEMLQSSAPVFVGEIELADVDPQRVKDFIEQIRGVPTRASLIRLVGMVLFEQDDDWQDGRRYFSPESIALIDAPIDREEVSPALLIAS